MSSPTDDSEKNDDHLKYAPKWARDRHYYNGSPSIAGGEFPQHSEQSFPAEDLSTDQVLQPLQPDTGTFRDAQRAPIIRRPLGEGQHLDNKEKEPPISERELFNLQHSLIPEFLKEPWPTPRTRKGRTVKICLALAGAMVGTVFLLYITDTSPGHSNTLPGLSVDKTAFMSRFFGDTQKIPERIGSAPGVSTVTAAPKQPSGIPTRVASVGGANESAPAIRGVTDSEVRFGISAPFTGAAKELGNQMRLGIETAFKLANDADGINGRQVKLVVADDGYEPTRTADTMKQLFDKQQVFGFVGNVGTPTAVVALPYALEHHALFFGAFTGADLLRRDPPDRYVFNYRASYAEETDAVVRYLVKMRHLRPDQIAVFAQHDAFGDAGFAGIAKAMRALRSDDSAILRLDYERNTVDVDNAIAGLRAHKTPIKAVVMVAAYRAAAKFIEKTRDLYPSMIYTNVSFVGSTALASELMLLGPRYANGVIVTQVVPAVDGYSSAILKYRTALAKYFPGEAPDYVSLEGYVDGTLLLEGLKRAGPKPDTETLVDALENLRNFDIGLGAPISFSQSDHQGSHRIWGTQLDDHGHFQPIDLQ
jgi:branched-chain amino acid transport system substrate-binding protein